LPKVKIMIVEDESIIAFDIKRTLIGLGYETSDIVETGEEAIKLAGEYKPDLILMDILLKGDIDGIEAAKKILDLYQIPVVYLTAHEDDDTLNRTKTTKPYGFILKPFQDRDLKATIRMALYKFDAEKKLEESEKRYFRLAENARDMINRISLADGHYEYVNKASLEITGYGPEEFYHKPLLLKDIIHPDWRHYFDVQWSRLLEGDVQPIYEYQIIHKNGDIKWINQRNVLITNDKNLPIALESIMTDITEQKRAEQIIRKQQEEYRLILDTVPAMITYKDDNNRILRVNKLAAKIKGCTVEEMEGKYTEEFYPDEAAKFLEEDREVISTGIPKFGIVDRIKTDKGESLWIKTDKIPYRNEKGQIVGVIAFTQDITQQKQAEEQLLKSERRNTILINTIPDIMFQFNSEGTFLDCKAKNISDLFFLPQDFLNKKIDDVLPSEFALTLKKNITAAFKTGETQTFEFTISKNGEDTCFETRLVVSGEDEILAIMRDITERKKADLSLRDSEEKYRKLTHNAPIAITRLSIKTKRYEIVNDEFIRQSGYTLDEFNQLSIDQLNELIHPDDLDNLTNIYNTWVKDGFKGINHIIYRAFNKFGEQLWLDTYHYADLDTNGNPVAINQLYIDITEQKRYEEAVRLSEAKFRAVCDISPAAIYIFQNEKFLYGNEYALELTGYTLDEVKKMKFWDVVHPDFKEILKSRGLARIRGEKVINRYEAKIMTKSGEEKWLDFTVTLFELNGKPAVLGNGLDITEQKKSRDILQLSEEKYRKLAENSPLAVTRLLVKDSTYEFVNDEFTRQSGYTKDEFNALSDTELIDMIYPEDRERVFSFYNQWRKENFKGVKRIDYRIINRNKKVVWLDTYLYAEFDSFGNTHAVIQICIDISERKAAEEALKQSELKFRAVTEAIQASIVITKGERIVYVNPYFEHIFGYEAKDLFKMNFLDLVRPDYKKVIKERIITQMKGEYVDPVYDFIIISRSGKERWAQISSVLIEYENQKAILSLVLDVTEVKNAEDLIKLSEEKFRVVAECMPAEIVIFQDERFVYANPYAEILTGYKVDEIVGENFWEFTHPDFKDVAKQRGLNKLLGKKEPVRYEMKILTKEGTEKWVDYSSAQVIYNGKPAVLGTAIDITERKVIEEALRESEARYRAIVEDQTEMIYRWMPDGTLTYVNDAYSRYFKKSKNELIGTKFYITIPEEEYQKFEKHFKSLNFQNPVATIEHRMVMPDKEIRWQRWTDRALFDENKKIIGYQSVGRDITELKKSEDEIKQSLLEKEVLLKEIHHRVKNNLQIITSLLKLQSTYVKDKRALELFKESQNRVQSMALIHQKLYQSKNLGKINFDEYLRTLIAYIMQSFGTSKPAVEVNLEAKDIFMSIDNAIPCGLIINELVTNSYKHAFKGRKKGMILIRLTLKQNKYTLEVKDDGIGIPDKINITESRTFGLKLISTLVEQIRGSIQITRPKGTLFTIIFE